jgi:hypothetical protein
MYSAVTFGLDTLRSQTAAWRLTSISRLFGSMALAPMDRDTLEIIKVVSFVTSKFAQLET